MRPLSGWLADIPPERAALLGQLLRYLVAGGIVTAVQLAIYWLLASPLAWHPQAANLTGYLVAVVLGFIIHGKVTFRGHGQRGSAFWRGVRFIIVSLFSYGLNAFWVWLCTAFIGWPEWSPIPLMGTVTPALVFLLNRNWVFR